MGFMQGYLSAQDTIASTKLKEQQAQENVMKLDEQRRMLEENARSRDIQTKVYNAPQEYKTLEIPNAIAPQGLVPTQQLAPQEGATGLGGMTTPQQAPAGMMLPAEGATGLGGMTIPQEVAPTGMQQVVEPTTRIAKAQASAKTYTVAESELQKVQKVADELRKAGLPEQANSYLEKQTSLIKNVESTKDAHLKNTAALAEHVAGLGNGFLEAVKNGGDPNQAWAEMLIKASAEGYPIESLLSVVDPKERMVRATQIVDEAESTKQRAQMEREIYKEGGRNKRAQDSATLRTTLSGMTTQRAAANQAAIQERWKAGQDVAKYKTSLSNFETNIKNAQRDRDDYDTQISVIDKKIADIDNLTNLSIPKEERPAAVEALRQQREVLSTARSSADKDVKDQETSLKELQAAGKLLDQKETTSTPKVKLDTTKYNYTKAVDPATREGYKKVMDHAKSLLKTNPQEAERIQSEAQKRMLDAGYLVKAL